MGGFRVVMTGDVTVFEVDNIGGGEKGVEPPGVVVAGPKWPGKQALSSSCGAEGSDWDLSAAMVAFWVPLIILVPSLMLGWPLGAHFNIRSAYSPAHSGQGK